MGQTQSTSQSQQIISQYQVHGTDTGSSAVQIALLTTRINDLTEHFKVHKKDHAGRRGLLMLVSRRRRLLDYLKNRKNDKYQELLKALSIRK